MTPEGFVLIDHKASPRARSDWEEIALGYSGQLEAYSEGISRATGKPVASRWIHFAVTGGMVGDGSGMQTLGGSGGSGAMEGRDGSGTDQPSHGPGTGQWNKKKF